MSDYWDYAAGQKFLERVKEITKNKTQDEIAYEFTVSAKTFSQWVNGKTTPGLDKIFVFCQKYNVSVDDVLAKNYLVSKDMSIADKCRSLIELDNAQTLHIEFEGIKDGKASTDSKIIFSISPKAKNDHSTETLIDAMYLYSEIKNAHYPQELKDHYIYEMLSRIDEDVDKKLYQNIIDGVFNAMRSTH